MTASDQSGTARDHPYRVVIVGGGIAGLAAAEALARAELGIHVTLLEARRVTGGRAGSFQDRESQQAVDYCQHVAMGCCTELIGLLDRCHVLHHFRRDRELLFLHRDFAPSRFAASTLLPPPLHLAPALAKLKYLTFVDRLRISAALWKLMRQTSESLGEMAAGEWLWSHYQTDRTIKRFWDVILVSALGERTETVSMSMARKVIIDGFAAARGASDVLVPTRPLTEVFGIGVSDALKQLGVQLETSVTVQQIAVSGDIGSGDVEDPLGSSVKIDVVGGEPYLADHVIVAVPWYRLDNLLSDRTKDLLQTSPLRATDFPASPITGIHLWLDRRITDQPHAVLVDSLAQWIFQDPLDDDTTASDAASGEHYYQVVISARYDEEIDRDALIQQVMAELRQFFPDAAHARLLRSRVVTDPKSVFSVTPAVQRSRPATRTAHPWLSLAGDWVQTGWPSTMEGAVISGRLAARNAFANLPNAALSVSDLSLARLDRARESRPMDDTTTRGLAGAQESLRSPTFTGLDCEKAVPLSVGLRRGQLARWILR
ncbi:MAG: hydroxysqualene dehydroxylase HpnE [Planctomycetota bacterium]